MSAIQDPNIAAFERALMRRGLGAARGEHSSCHVCRRTPLVGEAVHVFDGDRVLCELCRRRRGEDPARSLPVRGDEHGHAVRPRAA